MTDADLNYTPGTGFAAVADEVVRRAQEIRSMIKSRSGLAHGVVVDPNDIDDLDELDERGMRETRLAAAAELLLTALTFVAKAGGEGYHQDLDASLADTEGDIGQAVRQIREVRAAHAESLARRRGETPPAGAVPGAPESARLFEAVVRLAGSGSSGDEALIEIGEDGRARWSSREYGRLPANALAQLDLSALARDLDDVYARVVLGG